MPGLIYTIQDDGHLVGMKEQPYDSESLLQGLLAQYPDLLAGDQMNAQAPRRWLLVAREMTVPGDESGISRWSVDHLFLDQDAIPTIVEVKRSGDTRIRREVVGQMLDYAANAVAYWPAEELRARFEVTCTAQGQEPDEALRSLVGEDGDPEQFWEQARVNLRAGKLRLVFVADLVPPELQRVVEFLNTHMETVEVVGVEVRQYTGSGLRTLVPRVVGYVQRRPPGDGVPKTSREGFMASLDPAGTAFFGKLLALADRERLPVHWGKRGFSINVDAGGDHVNVLYGYPPSSVYRQSVYTAFAEIVRKVPVADSIVDWYRERLLGVGGFATAGNELKRGVDAGLAGATGDALLDIVSSAARKIRDGMLPASATDAGTVGHTGEESR